MPRLDSELQKFLKEGLLERKYSNLNWVGEEEGIFQLSLTRKSRGAHQEKDQDKNAIFKDWDIKKGHVYDVLRSKNRFLVSMRNSSYLKKLSSSSYSVTYQFLKEVKKKKEKKKKVKAAQFVDQNVHGYVDRKNMVWKEETRTNNDENFFPLISGSDFSGCKTEEKENSCNMEDLVLLDEDDIFRHGFLEDHISNYQGNNYDEDHNYYLKDYFVIVENADFDLHLETFSNLGGVSFAL